MKRITCRNENGTAGLIFEAKGKDVIERLCLLEELLSNGSDEIDPLVIIEIIQKNSGGNE